MTKSGKHCGKRRNCSFWAISSFVTMFSKSRLLQRRQKASIRGKGLKLVYTSPGCIVPTEGETVTGASFGTTNSNDVGPTGAISPEIFIHKLYLSHPGCWQLSMPLQQRIFETPLKKKKLLIWKSMSFSHNVNTMYQKDIFNFSSFTFYPVI